MRILVWPKSNNNPYVSILYDELENKKIEVLSHREYRIAWLFKKIDIFHFHWINAYLNHRCIKACFATFAFIIYLIILKLKKTKIIWTLHNSKQFTHHQKNKILERILVRYLLKIVDVIILHSRFQLNHINKEIQKKVVIIPHHNYCSLFEEDLKRLKYYLFFGSIAPYKGIEEAIVAFKNISTENNKFIFKIVGSFSTKEYKEKIFKLIDNNPSIQIEDRYASDKELEVLVKQAKAIILPFKQITNSGSLIYSLSCRTPVFIKESDITSELLSEYPEMKKVVITYKDNDQLMKIISKKHEYTDSIFDRYLNDTDISKIVKKYIHLFNT